MSQKPRLISFDVCPFVQRSVITLLEKKVDFDIDYIDLANKPDWFLKLSPTGKVPVLQVGNDVLFESAVINEYLDEVYAPMLHAKTPLERAKHRAWIEFGSSLLVAHYQMTNAADEAAYNTARETLYKGFARVEDVLSEGPYFAGDTFMLVDAAWAPLMLRLHLLARHGLEDFTAKTPKVSAWQKALVARPSVTASVDSDFEGKYIRRILDKGGYSAGKLAA
ncbi:MAG: glutathione S-transferase family protein [Proteobacteria bacterium]|nr:glutathione S-transferase family protein [Pseudomonadota bacterium]